MLEASKMAIGLKSIVLEFGFKTGDKITGC